MDRQALTGQLERALADAPALAELAQHLGYQEPAKSATNLELLQEMLGDLPLLATIAEQGLRTADPDAALNNLERLLGCDWRHEVVTVLGDETCRARLLTILGASSFLTGILCRRGDYFRELFVAGGIDRFKDRQAMLEELRQLIDDGMSLAELQKGVRCYKHREILRIGARDLCGIDDVVTVTAQLSDLASASLQRGYEVCDALLRREYGTPLEQQDEGEREAEFTVFGMGKLGGRELNFSSDIDLIYFYSSDKGQTSGIDDGRGGRRNVIGLHQYFVKLSELITKAIGQVTEDGFVFRVDLDLRPEGRSGEMANSRQGAETYYESWGRSWERAAMLKARPVAGSQRLGEGLLASLQPFIYRRYLDYGMVDDIKGMKQKIDRSLARQGAEELNLKLGRGGIREIEFFIQALQLIYAGKSPHLRERNSLKALDSLLAEGLIKEQEHGQLTAAYVFLRETEHRIQVFQERQTQSLPSKEPEQRALARRCGFEDAGTFLKELGEHREAVNAVFRDLFYTPEEEMKEEVRPEVLFILDADSDPDLVLDLLEEKGFKNPEGALEALNVLRDGPAHSPMTEQARRMLDRIAPLLAQAVLDSPAPEMALRNLEQFLGRLRARGTFFALLAENREIIKVLVSLFGSSQFLSRIFIQHPEILDSLVSRSYAAVVKEKEQVEQDLEALMQTATDYEARLDLLRRFKNEEFLRIAMGDISGNLRQGEGTLQLSNLAELCLQKAFEMAREELTPRFGLPFCRSEDGQEHEAGFAIVGMGKLGGQELNYHSDLDIIFVYEGEGMNAPAEGTDPDRFKQQSNQEYFARLAQRIISVLTLMTREGTVYEIDTRLRPSGNQGPLVTSLAAFERYHQESAQPWERQAMTKARPVTGQEPFRKRIDIINRSLVFDRPLPENLKDEIFRLRGRMESEIAKEGSDSFNIKTGRGGMVDVEFIVQCLQLLHGASHPGLQVPNTLRILDALEAEGLLPAVDVEVLREGYKFLRRLENKLRILHDHSISELSAERGYLAKLAGTLGYSGSPLRPEQAFLEDYRRVTEAVREVFSRCLAPS